MRTELTDEQIREVLTRAEEIHQGSPPTPDTEAIVKAAEEAGLPREAVEQALMERFGLPMEPPAKGQYMFAQSSDGHAYVAEVLDIRDQRVRVEFLKGGEHTLPLSEIKPCSFLPGQKLSCPWPSWGWWTCTVVSYNEKTKEIVATDGWSKETFHISDVRLAKPKKPLLMGRGKALLISYAIGFVSGGGLIGLLSWLLMR